MYQYFSSTNSSDINYCGGTMITSTNVYTHSFDSDNSHLYFEDNLDFPENLIHTCLHRAYKDAENFRSRYNTKEIRKMYDNNITKVRVFDSVATKARTRKDGTKIDKGEVTKITEVTFKDGDIERAYCDPTDTFDFSIGIIICIAKWACESSKGLYSQIDQAEEVYYKPFKEAKEKKIKEEEEKRRYEKRYKEKQKRIEQRKENRIEEQKEAFIRAIKELNEEKKKSSDNTDTDDYDTIESMLKDILYNKKKKAHKNKKKHKKARKQYIK